MASRPVRLLYAGRFDIPRRMREAAGGLIPSNHVHALPDLRAHGFEISSLALKPREIASSWAFQRRVLGALREVDILVAHSHYDLRGLAALRRAGALQCPVTAFVHSSTPRPWDRWLFAGFDCLFPLSRLAGARLADAGVSAERRPYFAYGADLGFYQPQPQDGQQRMVLSVGVSGRDYGTLIDAARFIDAPVRIVGAVEDGDRRRAGPNVNFISQGSYDLPFDKLRDLYRCAACVVVCHHGGEHPDGLNALVEAMAYGRPVVLTAGSGIDIDPGQAGFGSTVPSHDASALAAAVNAVLNAPDSWRRLGACAAQQCRERFNTGRMAQVLADTFAPLLRGDR